MSGLSGLTVCLASRFARRYRSVCVLVAIDGIVAEPCFVPPTVLTLEFHPYASRLWFESEPAIDGDVGPFASPMTGFAGGVEIGGRFRTVVTGRCLGIGWG